MPQHNPYKTSYFVKHIDLYFTITFIVCYSFFAMCFVFISHFKNEKILEFKIDFSSIMAFEQVIFILITSIILYISYYFFTTEDKENLENKIAKLSINKVNNRIFAEAITNICGDYKHYLNFIDNEKTNLDNFINQEYSIKDKVISLYYKIIIFSLYIIVSFIIAYFFEKIHNSISIIVLVFCLSLSISFLFNFRNKKYIIYAISFIATICCLVFAYKGAFYFSYHLIVAFIFLMQLLCIWFLMMYTNNIKKRKDILIEYFNDNNKIIDRFKEKFQEENSNDFNKLLN